jgi:hypothetical protein
LQSQQATNKQKKEKEKKRKRVHVTQKRILNKTKNKTRNENNKQLSRFCAKTTKKALLFAFEHANKQKKK